MRLSIAISDLLLLFNGGSQSFEDELLNSLSSEILSDVQVHGRIRSDIVRRNKLSDIASEPSNGAEFSK